MAILAVDFGSTFTKVTAICDKEAKIIGTAKSFTTIETDIRDGLDTALKELEKQTGKTEFSTRLAASSAGGGLKMIAVGLVPSLTAKAANTAACSAGAKVVKTYAYELSAAEQQEIYDINPDLILLSGGTDGGNKAVILHNAEKLAEIDRMFAVIVAGNKSVAESVRKIIANSGKSAVIAANVMPEFGKLDIMSAKSAIRDLFMEKIIEAKGLAEAAAMMTSEIIPTPLAVFEAAVMISGKLGSVMAVDIGGATTDVYSMCDGAPTQPGVVVKGLPEPFAKRTVEGDLGMRYSLDSLIDAANPEQTEVLAEYKALCAADPSFIPPADSPYRDFDTILAGMAVEIATERHCGRLESVYTPVGESFYQIGKDLTNVSYVIGVGGPIIYSPRSRSILEKALKTSTDHVILKPEKPKLLLDGKYIFAAMGLLSRVNSDIAMKILQDELKEA